MMRKTTTPEGEKVEYTLCPEFMKLVHLVMDGEATEKEEHLFLAHIEANNDCKEHYMEEQNIRAALKEKCGNAVVPDQLVQMIQLKLQEMTIA